MNFGIVTLDLGQKISFKMHEIIGNKSVLEHVSRVKKANFQNKIIINSVKKNDKIIVNIAKKHKCLFFCGNEKNVLDRFYKTAIKFKLKNIIRISGDSPFIDPTIIEKAVDIFKLGKFDIVTNVQHPSYPKGMSVEVFTFVALKLAKKLAHSSSDKEHVTKFFYRKKSLFKIKNFLRSTSARKYKFSLDKPSEIKRFRNLLFKLKQKKKDKNFSLKDLINISRK